MPTSPALIRRGLVFAAISTLALFLAACGGDDGNDYPEQVHENFVTACVGSGGEESFCECAWDRVTDAFTFEEYVEAEDEIAAGGDGAELIAVMADCIPD